MSPAQNHYISQGPNLDTFLVGLFQLLFITMTNYYNREFVVTRSAVYII
jgi:hypothetical protein